MLQNYIKVGLRSINRAKGFAFINIAGLAVGLSCSLLIAAYVIDDINYDSFHPNSENLYRVALERHFPDRQRTYAQTPLPMAAALYEDFPEVIRSTRLFKNPQDTRVRRDDQDFFERNYLLADSSFFAVFGIKLVHGKAHEVLTKPNSIVLTQSAASKYFGEVEAVGKMLIIGDTSQFIVSGICEDVPSRSHLEFDFLLSMISYRQIYEGSFWGSYNSYAYLVLANNTNKEELETKLHETVRQYVGPQLESVLGITYDQYVEAGNIHNYFLQPIKDIHLKSNHHGEIKPNGNMMNVYLFTIISIFILIIACINFVNLSTAQSAKRAKEVGVRKAIGSLRSNLIGQFLTESVILSFVATLLAFLFAILLLPYFNELASKDIALVNISPMLLVLVIIGLTVGIGLFAGLYPAFYLSSFDATAILKGSFKAGSKIKMRNILVVFQFSISVFLSIATLVVYQQMSYMKNKELGFEKEQMIIIDRANLLSSGITSFKDELLASTNVEAVTSSFHLPGRQMGGGTFEAIGIPSTERFLHAGMRVDYSFFDTYRIELVKGRLFSRDMADDDSLSVIINEATLKMVGWDEPIGKKIQPVYGPQLEIIGVVKDFHYASLQEEISPMVMHGYDMNEPLPFLPNIISVRIANTDNPNDVLAHIENSWSRRVNDRPLDYTFLDQEFDAQYKQEEQFGTVFTFFSILVIFIAIIGVIGLSTYMAAQRNKEIGIRKVLGASVSSIWLLLSRDFVILVVIANILMWPAAYFAAVSWLDAYAYQVSISLWPYLLVGGSSLIIVLLTIGFQSYKAAISNPVNSIRNE
jgi:putative ABC transport system permease protein